MADCPFCDYAGPSPILQDFGTAIVFEPIAPVVPGHVLVVPKQHVESARDAPGVTGLAMTWAAVYASARPEDFNLITSSGRAATQTVRHLHVHVVPRVEGDGLALPWTRRG